MTFQTAYCFLLQHTETRRLRLRQQYVVDVQSLIELF